MSDFHPETWVPAWSVASILNGVLSFMLESTVRACLHARACSYRAERPLKHSRMPCTAAYGWLGGGVCRGEKETRTRVVRVQPEGGHLP